MIAVRGALVGLGIAAVAWGAWLLSDEGFDRLLSTAIWLAGGLVLHDFVLAPIVIALGVVSTKVVPDSRRKVAAIAFLIWGTVTVAVTNVLLDVGGKPGMDSLLNRPYVGAWLALTGILVAVAIVVGGLSERRRRARAPHP